MQTVSVTRTIEELLARSAMYHALSVVLRHPGTETVKWLASREHRRLIDVVEMLRREDGGPLPEAIRRLVTALGAVSMTEWAQEYERTFGHTVQAVAPLYELEYGEEHSHRQPQELGDIAAFYQAFGLHSSAGAHERVDHLATECEFLQYLLYKQACATDENRAAEAEVCEAAVKRFLADHLGRWAPAFAWRLLRAQPHELLAAAAELTLAWLGQECARMQVAVGPRDLPLRQPKERDDVGCAACALNPNEADDGPTTCAVPAKRRGQVAGTDEVMS